VQKSILHVVVQPAVAQQQLCLRVAPLSLSQQRGVQLPQPSKPDNHHAPEDQSPSVLLLLLVEGRVREHKNSATHAWIEPTARSAMNIQSIHAELLLCSVRTCFFGRPGLLQAVSCAFEGFNQGADARLITYELFQVLWVAWQRSSLQMKRRLWRTTFWQLPFRLLLLHQSSHVVIQTRFPLKITDVSM